MPAQTQEYINLNLSYTQNELDKTEELNPELLNRREVLDKFIQIKPIEEAVERQKEFEETRLGNTTKNGLSNYNKSFYNSKEIQSNNANLDNAPLPIPNRPGLKSDTSKFQNLPKRKHNRVKMNDKAFENLLTTTPMKFSPNGRQESSKDKKMSGVVTDSGRVSRSKKTMTGLGNFSPNESTDTKYIKSDSITVPKHSSANLQVDGDRNIISELDSVNSGEGPVAAETSLE